MTDILEFAAQYRDARLTWDGLDAQHLMDIRRGKSNPGDKVPGQDPASEILDTALEGIISTPATSLEEALVQLWMVPYCAENIGDDHAFLAKVDKLIYSAVDVLERHTGLIRETYRFDSCMRRDFDPFAPQASPLPDKTEREGGAS